jgi:hypothetical protein
MPKANPHSVDAEVDENTALQELTNLQSPRIKEVEQRRFSNLSMDEIMAKAKRMTAERAKA